MCGNLMDYISCTLFVIKNIGRGNAPLNLLAPERNNLIRLRVCAGCPESSLGVL